MKQDYKLNSRSTHSYQILVDGKALTFRQRDALQTSGADVNARTAQRPGVEFGLSLAEAGHHSPRFPQISLPAPKREPMRDLRREILDRTIALTCRTALRAERLLELLLLDEETVAAERFFELGEQLQDILTLFSLLPVSNAARSCRAFAPEQLSAWQFEQLESVLEEIREANSSSLQSARCQVLQHRVLPWLDSMHSTLNLLHEMLPGAPRLTSPH